MVALFALLMTVILALKSGAVPIQWSDVFAIIGVGADVDPLKRSVLLELWRVERLR